MNARPWCPTGTWRWPMISGERFWTMQRIAEALLRRWGVIRVGSPFAPSRPSFAPFDGRRCLLF